MLLGLMAERLIKLTVSLTPSSMNVIFASQTLYIYIYEQIVSSFLQRIDVWLI